MYKILLSLTVLLFTVSNSISKPIVVKINHKLGSQTFDYKKQSNNNINDIFIINRLEYYLSEFVITHDGGITTKIDDSYILVQANNSFTLKSFGDFDINKVENIEFCIGVPASVNNSDPTKWAASHALSPKSPSMHWGWSSGYRFVALEGKVGQNFTTDFQFHSLGNKNYKKLSMNISSKNNDIGDNIIEIDADYNRAVENLQISTGIVNHSEEGEAAILLENFKNYVFQPTILLSVTDEINNIVVVPNPSSGVFKINDNDLNIDYVKIIDLSGRVVYEGEFKSNKEYSIEITGLYYLNFYKSNNIIVSQKIVINK